MPYAPYANAIQLSVNPQVAAYAQGSAYDPDGYTDTFYLGAAPAHGAATVSSSGLVSYTPTDRTWVGTDTFQYVADDGHGGTGTATATVTVTDPAPYANSATASTHAGTAVTVTPSTYEPVAGYTLTLSAQAAPAHGTVTPGAGQLTYTPTDPTYTGTDTFQYVAADGHGATATATITVTMTNSPPTATDVTVTQNATGPTTVSVAGNVSDPDGDPVTIVSVGSPANGTVTVSGLSLTYTPNYGYDGPDSFGYTVSDGHGGQASATVNMAKPTINFANNTPKGTAKGTIRVEAQYKDAPTTAVVLFEFTVVGDATPTESITGKADMVNGVATATATSIGSGKQVRVKITLMDKDEGTALDSKVSDIIMVP